MLYRIAFLLLSFLTLSACDRGDTDTSAPAISSSTPNSYLRYINTQASLGAGNYEVVVGTLNAGVAGDFTIRVTFDDDTTETLSGSWTSSGGQSSTDSNNPRFDIKLNRAGGITITEIDSTVSTYIYLLDKNDSIIAEAFSLIDLPNSRINNETYAQAYYAAVDPTNERTSLDGWRSKNGFSNSTVLSDTTHAIFRDTKDLGYGRDMYARTNLEGQPSFYVNNYLVALIPGESSNYGPLNLNAAIEAVTQGVENNYHIGTNAIEVSANPNDSSQNILKFFTFDASGNRITSANLDGRGTQFMPGICFSCHGGRLLPLDENGEFQLSEAFDASMPSLSVMNPKLNQLEVETFEFSDVSGYTEADMQIAIRDMNELVNNFYTGSPNETGNWNNAFGRELSEGRYASDFSTGDYVSNFVPTGWLDSTGDNPEGTEVLFEEVIEPNCLGCHALQGSTVGAGGDINFESYDEFMGHKDQVVDYVFQRGVMPLSLRNYESFWDDPTDRPVLLASFLVGSYENDRITEGSLSTSAQNALAILQAFAAEPKEPGTPIARAGRDITARSPVQMLATGSLFAETYSWSVSSSPVGSVHGFDNADSSAPVFTADLDGSYTLELTVTNGTESSTDSVQVTIDSTSADQNAYTFTSTIVPLLSGTAGTDLAQCVTCHTSTGASTQGAPLFYEAGNISYREVMARVNLNSPEDSRLLRKATGNHHAGGEIIASGSEEYNLLYNWIQSGAAE